MMSLKENEKYIDNNGLLILNNSLNTRGRFQYLSNLKKVIIQPDVTFIESVIFRGCDNLEEVEILGTDVVIGAHAFIDCVQLKEVKIKGFVKIVEESAFRNCKKLSSIVFPSGLTLMGVHAFENNESLKEIVLPETLTELRDISFCDTKIEEMVLPSSLKKVDIYSFYGMKNLKKITVNSLPNNIGLAVAIAKEENKDLEVSFLYDGKICKLCPKIYDMKIKIDPSFQFEIMNPNHLIPIDDRYMLWKEKDKEEIYFIKGNKYYSRMIKKVYDHKKVIDGSIEDFVESNEFFYNYENFIVDNDYINAIIHKELHISANFFLKTKIVKNTFVVKSITLITFITYDHQRCPAKNIQERFANKRLTEYIQTLRKYGFHNYISTMKNADEIANFLTSDYTDLRYYCDIYIINDANKNEKISLSCLKK